MVEPLRRIKKTDPAEMARRYKEARELLKRVLKACHKPHWQIGESLEAIQEDVSDWIGDELLEEKIFPETKVDKIIESIQKEEAAAQSDNS